MYSIAELGQYLGKDYPLSCRSDLILPVIPAGEVASLRHAIRVHTGADAKLRIGRSIQALRSEDSSFWILFRQLVQDKIRNAASDHGITLIVEEFSIFPPSFASPEDLVSSLIKQKELDISGSLRIQADGAAPLFLPDPELLFDWSASISMIDKFEIVLAFKLVYLGKEESDFFKWLLSIGGFFWGGVLWGGAGLLVGDVLDTTYDDIVDGTVIRELGKFYEGVDGIVILDRSVLVERPNKRTAKFVLTISLMQLAFEGLGL